jgi:hypothetical protein
LFRYLAARWRYRRSPSNRFVRSGLGLERRAQELSAFWSDHLSRSRAAQSRWAQNCQGDVLTVLGAGPLRDFNAISLGRSFKRFRLVDGNPMSPSYWGRLNIPVEPVITDISCCLDAWSAAVERSSGSWQDVLALIHKLGDPPTLGYSAKADAVLSLNLLSQLEVGWQESLEPILKKRFGRMFVKKREQDWLEAIRPSSKTLVEQHLASLECSAAQSVLLISDVEYLEYTGRKYSRKLHQPPPVTWSERGWQADPGIRYETTPALEGVALDAWTFNRWMPSYQLEWQDGWLWHISPHGTEATRFGMVHRVVAFSLRRY